MALWYLFPQNNAYDLILKEISALFFAAMHLLNPSIAIQKFQLFIFATASLKFSSPVLGLIFIYELLYIIIMKKIHYLQSTVKQWVQSAQNINTKVKLLANLIKNAKYPIFFTGAGCSTAIGIPDYRSGSNTMVPTGPGIWNRNVEQIPPKLRIDKIVDEAVPSLTHMAIKTLLDKQIFKYLVSQNTDGLHIKSGVGFNKISELHGNRNLQKCTKCLKIYFRDFRTVKRLPHKSEEQKNHLTDRQCQNCGGDLVDSIVYFGQKLPSVDLANAFRHAASCDLLLCIGSSLTVRPSGNVPVLALKNKARLSIVNIQETPFDSACDLKINGFCDQIMGQLMSELKIKIDTFTIEHYLQLEIKQKTLRLEGKDKSGNNCTYMKSIKYENREYEPKGHFLEVHIEQSIHQIQLIFYGSKSPMSLYLPAYYKLYHGQKILLKIQKKNKQENWQIQEL